MLEINVLDVQGCGPGHYWPHNIQAAGLSSIQRISVLIFSVDLGTITSHGQGVTEVLEQGRFAHTGTCSPSPVIPKAP